MGILFDRATELRIFAGGKKFTIRDLDMDFDVALSRDSKPNQAKITVYNLSRTTRGLISEAYQGIEFLAGYQSKPVLIFRGTMIRPLHTIGAYETSTAIFAGDGQKEFSTKIFNKAYAAGTPVAQILNDMTLALGLPSEVDSATVSATLTAGASFSGRVKDCLDKVTRDFDLSWSMQHGTTEIIVKGQPPIKSSSAVVLSSETGLIESPILTDTGIKTRSFLNPEIRPARLIQVKPRSTVLNFSEDTKKPPKLDAAGVYIVDRLQHTGSNHGGAFDTLTESDLWSPKTK
jgi:hypothetical protein